jgi:hypothetical protein
MVELAVWVLHHQLQDHLLIMLAVAVVLVTMGL